MESAVWGWRGLNGAAIAFSPVQSDSSAGNGPPPAAFFTGANRPQARDPRHWRMPPGDPPATRPPLGVGSSVRTPPNYRRSGLTPDRPADGLARLQPVYRLDRRAGSALGSAATADLPAFARVGRARLELSLIQLLHGRYVVQSGVVEDLDLQFVVDGDGRDNVPRPTSGPNHPVNRSITSSQPVDRQRSGPVHVPGAATWTSRCRSCRCNSLGTRRRRDNTFRSRVPGGTIQIGGHTDVVNRVSGLLDLGVTI